MEQKLFHKRKLPHLHPSSGTFFITYRLVNSLPMEIINNLKEEYRNENDTVIISPGKDSYFVAVDEYLDKCIPAKKHLLIPRIAQINKQAIHHFDNKYYQLICYCIMSNHIHLVIKLTEDAPDISQIMHSIKRYTAKESNMILGKQGPFWTAESYDHLVRNDATLKNIVSYVLNNPVKAGLVNNWKKWPHTYLREDYL
jgi:putative transposase